MYCQSLLQSANIFPLDSATAMKRENFQYNYEVLKISNFYSIVTL